MKNPIDKYHNDPEYHHLVDVMYGLIEMARFTPSELREAAILAAIQYEQRRVRSVSNPRLDDALLTLDREFVCRK